VLVLLLGGLIAAALAWVNGAHGGQLVFPGAAATVRAAEAPPIDPVRQLLVALTVIIATARALGAAFRLVGQPAVMGEVVGGLLLGPSFLGHVAPGLASALLPAAVAPSLNIVAQLGVILYMFLVGLEFDPGLVRQRRLTTGVIAYTSIAVPFLLGVLLAGGPLAGAANAGVPFASFTIFLGVALAITAFPVLARILTDLQISQTPLGGLALACAAANDATAWGLLALAVSVAQAELTSAVTTLLLTVGYVLLMLAVVRPMLRALTPVLERRGRLSDGGLALMTVLVLLAALGTEYIGIHALFGAFLYGALIPHDSLLARELRVRLEAVVRIVFLPAFFAYTGLRTQLGLVETSADWLLVGLIILVATLGKVGGTIIGARAGGLSWPEAWALGTLMNTRGLVELIALNIGLDLGIISPTLFTMLVLMALATTLATSPVFRWLTQRQPWTLTAAPPGATLTAPKSPSGSSSRAERDARRAP
jgi:Kef-type K+ transport system membrane component KefB